MTQQCFDVFSGSVSVLKVSDAQKYGTRRGWAYAETSGVLLKLKQEPSVFAVVPTTKPTNSAARYLTGCVQRLCKSQWISKCPSVQG